MTRHLAPWLTTVAVIVAMVASALLLYSLITDRIIDSALENSEELARHDEASIANSLDLRWTTLHGVGEELRQTKCESIHELLDLLRMKEQSLDCIDLALLSEDGEFYNGSLLVTENPELEAICRSEGDDFVVRYDQANSGTTAESLRQSLVFGVQIRPFSVDGVTFDCLICRMALNTLSNELKIDSYDGEGYSSVITREGDYIVSNEQTAAITDRENFFEYLEGQHIVSTATVEDIRTALNQGQTFSVTVSEADRVLIMQFTPMENTSWYFVTSVPRAAFEEQSMQILRMVLGIMVVMVVSVGVALLVSMRSRQMAARAAADATHRHELAQALDLAEQANRAKTTFLSSMSHDIRTPMNAIIGFTNLAQSHLDDPERMADYLNKISSSSRHLLSLINDVLDMSRIESGKVTIDETPEDLAVMLDEVRSIVQPDIDKRGQHFVVNADACAHTAVYVDRLRMNQVLINLLSNAVKFTPDGGTITVTAAQVDGEGDQGLFEISVADTGIGMSPEFAATVFDAFTREQTATVSGIQGTGLGMSITKNLVGLMGGSISVDSTPGEGTTFTVLIPLRLREPEEGEGDRSLPVNAPETMVEALQSEEAFKGLRLLLADDNLLSRELACEILEEAGFLVECVEDGAQEVEAVAQSEPGYFDVVLSDVQMPIMDGHAAARAIRELDNPDLASIPIIACTANAFEEDAVAARAAGMNAHMGKPIDVPTLIETLKKVLAER